MTDEGPQVTIRAMIDPAPQSGRMNMAIDETLLESALDRGESTFRLYRWSEPTVSLGYFQRPEEASADPALDGLPLVRRLSGGGAILHHDEWTYSIALAPDHPLAARPLELYRRMHAVIVGWLRTEGIPARMRDGETDECDRRAVRADENAPAAVDARGLVTFPEEGMKYASRVCPDVVASADVGLRGERASGRGESGIATGAVAASSGGNRRPEPFLCFGRGDPRDIVLLGHKIVGSAQRRRRGAVLQHGSILMRRSIHAPQFPGLIDLAGRADLEPRVGPVLAEQLPRAIGRPIRESLNNWEWSRSASLASAEAERVESRRRVD